MFANWPVATQRRVLVSLPVSELSDDLFPQRGRKRLLARDHAGLPNRLAHLIDVGAAAGAAREVSLEPLPLVGRQRVVEVVGDDLDHLLTSFDEYLSRRANDSSYTFRHHLRQIGGAIEE